METHEVDHEPQQDKPREARDIEALRLAAFCTYMQHGKGLASKSPGYMREKWALISRCDTAEQMTARMDDENQATFNQWLNTWGRFL